MGVLVPVAGAYTGTYTAPAGSPLAIGALNDDGWEVELTFAAQEMANTDVWGQTLVEAIHRGMNARLRARAMEWGKAGLTSLLQPFGVAAGGNAFQPLAGNAGNPIGRRYTDLAGSLILTSTSGTPAASSPATLTATAAILAPNSRYNFNLTSKIREVPFEMVLFPFTTTISMVSVTIPFSTT